MTERAATAAPKQDPKTGRWGWIIDAGVDPETGKRKQHRRRGFATKKEAKDALDAKVGELRDGTYVAPTRQTVGEYLDEWLAMVAGDLQPSTHASYARNIRVHVRPRIGALQLQKLSASHLNTMYAALRESVDPKTGKLKTLSPRSIRYLHTIVRAALKEAVRSGRVPRNVADAARPPRAKETRAKEMSYWSAADVGRFFTIDEVAKHRDRTAWWVAFNTGLRRGELLGLRWRDVDLTAGTITVAQTVTAIDHKVVTTPGTKTGSGRTIGIDETTVAEFKAFRKQTAERSLLLGRALADDALVFATPDGDPLDPDRFSERFIRCTERHPELPRLRFHDVRHTWATLALKAGVPLAVVSKHLGHSSITVTADTYSHVSTEMKLDAADRVGALLRAAVGTKQ
jgi:integrase